MTAALAGSAIPLSDLIPDLCRGPAILRVLLVSQMLAGILVLADPAGGYVLGPRLIVVSLFLHWLSLCSCALLCALRSRLASLPLRYAVLCALIGLQLVTGVVSELGWQVASWLEWRGYANPREHLLFLARTQLISLLVWIMLLRYFFLQQQWQAQARAAVESRLLALQARIRPHFLFNALNSLAALIPDQPRESEKLVENLAELLRVSLERPDGQHTLAEEIALTRSYTDIEQLRLGARLQLEWDLDPALDATPIPILSLQPLVENAVYHGIEERRDGGSIQISTRRAGRVIEITVRNPVGEHARRSGQHLALANIRHRLALLYGPRAGLETRQSAGTYLARLWLPA